MEIYNKSKEEILYELGCTPDGLSKDQRIISQNKYGKNQLPEPEKTPIIVRFLSQIKDPLTLVLIFAAIISIIADPHEWLESLIIVSVVLFNAILGVVQENNAEKSLEALKKLSGSKARIMQDGEKISINSSDVVVGDILVVEAGDQIASDGRIIQSWNLQIDESALTGESLPVDKHSEVIDTEVSLGDRKNMVFAGTVCTYGRALVCITSVGTHNEVGKIAKMLVSETSEQTPLQVKLSQISKVIGAMCIGICVVVFGLELASGLSILEAFKTSVALAVAAIPEGLATVVTVCLALGVSKMAKKNAVVRKLPAVETLGCCSVICSDKTGTLTQNRMTITDVYIPSKGRVKFNTKIDDDFKRLLQCFTLCSDANLIFDDDEMKMVGDPTETAFVYASWLLGDNKAELNAEHLRLNEIAFDSDRKMMTVFVQGANKVLQITKGAPDVVLSLSINNSPEASKMNDTMASEALRVLAVAVKEYDKMPEILEPSEIEKDMEFLGLAGMIDPPRLEVKDAILEAKTGGIKTVMITGDHLTTASAIAKDLGILTDGDIAISGAQLSKMSDEELECDLEKISVYARVAPEHKVRIVNAWQKKGHVVAMTGDGVNDSPALKTADIGCAMGITGTDVAKQSAEMVLMDDNFATILAAVKEGRTIYSNIKKDVQFLLSSNIGEVLTIFSASILNLIPGFNLGIPLMPIHLLWINLITDSLPAFALGLEAPEDDVMNKKPRPKNESFFANGLGVKIAWQGIMIGVLTLLSYIVGLKTNHETGMTMAFLTLSASQLIHAFNVKSNKTIFSLSTFNNKYLIGALLIGMLLQLGIVYVIPLANLFSLVPLNLELLIIALGFPFLTIIISEIYKLIEGIE